MVKSSNCEVFATYFMSCVGQRKIYCGDTARLSWIPCEFCRELGEAKPRNSAARGKPKQEMLCLCSQCLLSEKWLAQMND